ncbi:MAG: hypothetical protein M1326_04785 [Cyanobacteria bacterium]|nr:hypothetical protein [Cyanobacteriota bacterium]
MHPKKFALRYARKNIFMIICVILLIYFLTVSFYYKKVQQIRSLNNQINSLMSQKQTNTQQMLQIKAELETIKNEDQYKINKKLETNISEIENAYNKAVKAYEKLLDLKLISKDTDVFDKYFTESLSLLSQKNYASASASLDQMINSMQSEKEKITSVATAQNVKSSNVLPTSGFQQQMVNTTLGDYLLDIISADLNSTRVIVDTATDGDCDNNCPVMALGDYVSRNNAYAGVNGTYFCPESYPSCAGKTNSFDTLVMNKNKKYINSGNNVYSTVPAAIFYGNTARFVAQSLEWGRDTSIDAVIANRPLLVLNGNNAFSGTDQAKEGIKGSRSFIGNKK